MQKSSAQIRELYTLADVRRLACEVLGQLDGIAAQPIESDIYVGSTPEGINLDCRVVACVGRPFLQLGRSAQQTLREAIQAVSSYPLREIRIIIDDVAPAEAVTKPVEE